VAWHGRTVDSEAKLLLALETTAMCGSVALVAQGLCVGEYSLQAKGTHSRRLLTAVEWLMDQARCDWSLICGIAVSLGPGSFTGLRIGMSTAQGLAMAADKPLLGVPTLDAIAAQFSHLGGQPLCVVVDARKKEVYTAFYRCLPDSTVQRISDYLVLAPEELARRISVPTVMVGDGVALYGELFRELLGDKALLITSSCHFPRAAAVGMLAWPLFHRREFLDATTAVPIYVRASDAELNFIPPQPRNQA